MKANAPTLDEAVSAARDLPANAQSELALEIMERISNVGQSLLNEQQRAEIKRRLAEPRRYVPEDEMRAFFARYGVVI